MIRVDQEKCNGCKQCEMRCPLGAIKVVQRKAVVQDHCSTCRACLAGCKTGALSIGEPVSGNVLCTYCDVRCQVPPGYFGACKRFTNADGKLVRNRPLQVPERLPVDREKIAISRPLITAVGAGASYPDYHPAPYIVQERVEDFDVVTVVTEAPVSYSSMMVKIDTNLHIGDEGAPVKRDGKVVGMVTAEQYGSHILILGGVNRVKGPHGLTVVKTIAELGNQEPVRLKIEGGATLDLQVGKSPVIDGVEDKKMRVGCGGACCALFAKPLSEIVDEAIILDHHITGLLTQRPAGAELLPYSGVEPVGRLTTPGRYFFEHGNGWGGTNIQEPRQAIKFIDMRYARPGMKILVAETTFRKVALFVVNENGEPEQVPLTPEIEAWRQVFESNCEESRVAAMYYAGVGGSARAGVTVNPIKLTQAVHRGDAVLTIAGAPAYVMPGGGITFLADVEQMVPKPFTYTTSQAVVAPIEYTIIRSKYAEIGGHIKSIRPFSEVIKEGRFQWYQKR
ncbi:6-hydroxynicotinate reductase [Clostridiales bacterium PH28_bin88]|nr:6-hydroxynicotinate reductase [Clostridiales bacterium PH28_bin88]